MGMSPWQLGIVLLIAVLVFGTKRLRSLGTDVGGALRGFRKAMNEADSEETSQLTDDSAESSESVQAARDRADS